MTHVYSLRIQSAPYPLSTLLLGKHYHAGRGGGQFGGDQVDPWARPTHSIRPLPFSEALFRTLLLGKHYYAGGGGESIWGNRLEAI